ncbi:IS66 family insertion sequence element accessory protein TnpA [Dyadobacter bucti]|uniref:IS66 family insertion sequence element accessory protein TnpA n=1 Tax=Dyadobacter bucti TaxID=2572203 RepID=UPI003F7288F1
MFKGAEKAEEMLRLVAELESGGYDRQSLVRLHGISVSKLDYWRARYRRQNSDRSGFVEIVNEQGPVLLEVVYPSGVLIRVKADLAPARLRQLVTLL